MTKQSICAISFYFARFFSTEFPTEHILLSFDHDSSLLMVCFIFMHIYYAHLTRLFKFAITKSFVTVYLSFALLNQIKLKNEWNEIFEIDILSSPPENCIYAWIFKCYIIKCQVLKIAWFDMKGHMSKLTQTQFFGLFFFFQNLF